MKYPSDNVFFIVDVFSSAALRGNPLAVVFGQPDDRVMLDITREMNYSETTFVGPPSTDQSYPIRIFTPSGEIPFAGHPTLGTAFVLRELLGVKDEPIILEEKIGPIAVHIERRAGQECYWMTQHPPRFGSEFSAAKVAKDLGLAPSDIDTHYPIQEVSTGLGAIIVPLVSLDAVRRARAPMSPSGSAVLIFSQEAEMPGHDVHVRVFVGSLGIPEDPATGSANGALAAYLAQYLKSGVFIEAVVEQGIEIGRPSTLYLRVDKRSTPMIVEVGGHVVPVAEGRLVI